MWANQFKSPDPPCLLQWFAEVINGVGKEEEREEETNRYLSAFTYNDCTSTKVLKRTNIYIYMIRTLNTPHPTFLPRRTNLERIAFNHNIAKRKRENRPFKMVMDNGSSMKSPQQQQQEAANSNGSQYKYIGTSSLVRALNKTSLMLSRSTDPSSCSI